MCRGYIVKKLNKNYFLRDTKKVAEDLIGSLLVRNADDTVLKGMIVETEAYYGENDPASHASNGKTDRNEIMYGEPGYFYVYLCYGMYYLLNVVTEEKGVPGAVLIRSVKPVKGIEKLKKNRGRDEDITNGPGKLTEAFEVDKNFNGVDVSGDLLYFERQNIDYDIGKSSRVGIKEGKDRLLRFYLKGSSYIST